MSKERIGEALDYLQRFFTGFEESSLFEDYLDAEETTPEKYDDAWRTLIDNGALIGAAPELLKVLEDTADDLIAVHELLEERCGGGYDYITACRCLTGRRYRKVHAVLTKAKREGSKP